MVVKTYKQKARSMDFKEIRENLEKILGEIGIFLDHRRSEEARKGLKRADELLGNLRAEFEKGNNVQERAINRLSEDIQHYRSRLEDLLKRQPYELMEESDLFRLGYKITNMTQNDRWNILVSLAVPKYGAEKVIDIILMLVKMRMATAETVKRNQNALSEWIFDVERLIDEYKEDLGARALALQKHIKNIEHEIKKLQNL